MKELAIVIGLILFGIILSAFITVFKKVKEDGFDGRKFFNDNKKFWIVCIIGDILFGIGIVYVEGFSEIINQLGFAIENSQAGYVLLGIAMAITSDKSGLTGKKTLITNKK